MLTMAMETDVGSGRKGQATEMPGQVVFWILALIGLVILVIIVMRGGTLFRNLFGT